VTGIRERKKQRTRDALVDAAVRLFREKGFAQTTVAEIAAAADVSTRTFFLHFPTKEAVVLANAGFRVELAVGVLTGRDPAEGATAALARAVREMVAHSWRTDLSTGLAALRSRLVATEPAVRAGMTAQLAAAQDEITGALLRAYPDQLDHVRAATLVGAVIGAVSGAAHAALTDGAPPDDVRTAMLDAVAVVLPPS
jgi:AcrR family transcriptional regulator